MKKDALHLPYEILFFLFFLLPVVQTLKKLYSYPIEWKNGVTATTKNISEYLLTFLRMKMMAMEEMMMIETGKKKPTVNRKIL